MSTETCSRIFAFLNKKKMAYRIIPVTDTSQAAVMSDGGSMNHDRSEFRRLVKRKALIRLDLWPVDQSPRTSNQFHTETRKTTTIVHATHTHTRTAQSACLSVKQLSITVTRWGCYVVLIMFAELLFSFPFCFFYTSNACHCNTLSAVCADVR